MEPSKKLDPQQQQPQQQQQLHLQQLHPLDLPEILYLLASTLSTDIRTLSKCSQVNKTWHNAFNPYLWRSLSCTRLLPMGHLSRKAIDRNVHLVHQIRVGKLDQARYGMLEECRNLRRLHLEDERVSEWDLMGLAGSVLTTTTTTTTTAGTGTGKGKKVKAKACGSKDARRRSVPNMMLNGTLTSMGVSSAASSSSSSSVMFLGSASVTVAGASSTSFSSSETTSSITSPQDEAIGLDYDGDDEDDDNDDYSGDRWVELLIALIKRNPSLQKICIMMERFEPTTTFWESIEQASATTGPTTTGAWGGGGSLKSLECVFTRIPTPQLVTSFLSSLTHLESLVLQHCTFEGPSSFPTGILLGRHYPTLQSLTLATNAGFDLPTQLQFIQCFPNLQSLSWSIMGSSFPLLVPEFCILLQTHCPHISSLVLSDRNLEPHDLSQILHAIPRLVRFFLRFDAQVSMFNDKEVMDGMRRHFGWLKDLEFGQVRSKIRCGTVLEFLRGCPKLERLVAYGRLDCSRVGMMHFSVLENGSGHGSGGGDGGGGDESSLLSASFATTPMVGETMLGGGGLGQNSGSSASTYQQHQQEPHLEHEQNDNTNRNQHSNNSSNSPYSNNNNNNNNDDDYGEEGNTTAAKKDAPWVCLDLKTLHVIMTGDPQNIGQTPSSSHQQQHSSYSSSSSSSSSLQHHLFHQLGRLSNLQQLSLGHCILWMYENGVSHHGLDFTLEAGLAQLAGLKKLEELNLEGIYQRMGENDVRWMLDHWPRLRVVEGELHYRREERVKLDVLMEQRGFKILNHSYRK